MSKTVNYDAVKRDITKALERKEKASPGSLGRRYEPPGGLEKHRERIHRESKEADKKNLPFTFRKPYKPLGRSTLVKCDNCGALKRGTSRTVGIICSSCKKFSSVTEVRDER